MIDLNINDKNDQISNNDSNSNNSSSIKPKTITTELFVEKPNVGSIDHLAISESLGYQIFRKSIRNAWKPDEDNLLKKLLIEQYLKINNLSIYNNEQINIKDIDWVKLANNMNTKRRAKECRKRWISSLDPFIKKGKWTKDEDNELVNAFKKHGPNWNKVSSEIKGRNEDQCSKRYLEVLNCDTKERLRPWKLDEDLILINCVKNIGTKWRQVSISLPGRPSLTCRNRWRKIMNDIAKDTANDIIKKAVGVLDENGIPIVKFTKLDNKHAKNNNNNNNSKIIKNSKNKDKGKDNDSNEKNDNKDNNNKIDKNDNNISNEKNDSITTSSNVDVSPEDIQVDSPIINDNFSKLTNNKRPIESINNEQSYKKFKSDNQKTDNNTNTTTTNNNNNIPFDNYSTSYTRIATPLKTQTDWKFSLIDPRTNEELKDYNGKIDNQELAHYLIELARLNGVALTVHQHIHHHYSPTPDNVNIDPQANFQRYGHFNYLPPLIEVPKLSSSSSPANTNDSNNSNKTYNESSLLRLLNNNEDDKIKNKNKTRNGNINNEKNYNKNSTKETYLSSQRQQLFPSTSNYITANSPSTQATNNTSINNSINNKKNETKTDKKKENNNNNNNNTTNKSFNTEVLEEELDFWETMRSNKPVSQHHPLHYYQPSNYKEQSPYQTSDSFGIQRFPNMATPLAANMINNDKNINLVQNNVTNLNNDHGYGSIYLNGEEVNEEDDEEEEIDIANQYGMYYSVFANKSNGNFNNFSKQNNSNVNNNNNNGPTGLINSGYLMPFNPS